MQNFMDIADELVMEFGKDPPPALPKRPLRSPSPRPTSKRQQQEPQQQQQQQQHDHQQQKKQKHWDTWDDEVEEHQQAEEDDHRELDKDTQDEPTKSAGYRPAMADLHSNPRPNHEWTVTTRHGRSADLSAEDVATLRAEQALAERAGLTWQERGPPGPEEGGPGVWRGQNWRAGTGRFANRGGKWKELYTQLARSGALSSKGKGKNKAKGGGKGSGDGKSGGSSSSSASSSRPPVGINRLL